MMIAKGSFFRSGCFSFELFFSRVRRKIKGMIEKVKYVKLFKIRERKLVFDNMGYE